jgi:hypothetical protein
VTVTTSAFAPFDASYFQRTPYLTIDEYQSAPTSMDTSNLIPGGNPAAQLVSLGETIGRASSWIDQFCMGAWGTLCATSNIENARVWGTNYGTLPIHTKYWPILQVDTFSYSPVGANGFGLPSSINMAGASITPAGSIWIEPQQFIVQPSGLTGFGLNTAVGICAGQQYYCTYTYTNGWPVTTLSASVSAGSASIAPASVLGMYPGTMLTFYDEPYNEPIQIASTYEPNTSPVPLTTGTLFNHASGVMVTNLPPAVKQAAILATTAFIKQRGSGALVVSDMGATTHQQTGFSQNSGSDWAQAKILLQPFRQMFVGT